MPHTRTAVSAAVAIALLSVSCGGGGSAGTNVSVSVTPATANVAVGESQQFSAMVTGTTNTAVTWSVAGGAPNGTISPAGLYLAPAVVPAPAQVTVSAASQADPTKIGTATVTILPASSNVHVSVSPAAPTVALFGIQQFTAAVTGTSNSAVTWEVNGTAGGSKQFGFISSTGLYLAPGGVPTKSDGKGGSTTTTLTITAVSAASSTATGSATVTLLPANQGAQNLPIALGASGGNANDSTTSGQTITCCGVTLGSLVTRGGTQFILSNNHVLARSDIGAMGDPISSPGLIDNNCRSATPVANLTQFYNLESGAPPKIDAAIAQVAVGDVDPGGKILYLGSTTDSNGVPVAGAPHAGSGITAIIGEPVAKSGRSTGLTCSTVFSVNTATSVQYQKGCGTGPTFDVSYTNQVDVAGGSFSAEGDSGSLIVDQTTADPVALLFAGSDTDAVGNPVADVLNFFKSGSNSVTFAGGGPHVVVGCTLPTAPQSGTLAATSVSSEALQQAISARDAHYSELLAHPQVQAVGIGPSYDAPGKPAVLLFVAPGPPQGVLPAVVDGVRTRIVQGPLFAKSGAVSAAESAELEKSAAPAQLVYHVAPEEIARAHAVQAAHLEEWMSKRGVQGFGIGSSADAPGQPALVIFLIRGEAHEPIPAVIDGVRTRVREGSRFRAGVTSSEPRVPACHAGPSRRAAGAKTSK
jgi:hypothetical protein